MPRVERWHADGTGLLKRRGRVARGTSELAVVVNTLSGLPDGPISATDLRTALAAPGMTDNTTMRGRVAVSDIGGAYGKALSITLPNTSDGVVFQPALPEAFDKGYIEYDFRWRAPFPYGRGGKLPGLGGFRAPLTAPPSGGNSSPDGWAGRCMWLGDSWGGSSGIGTELIGYPYLPWQTPGSYGVNRLTGHSVGAELGTSDGAWRRLRIVTRMNTVTTEGATNPPADGVHQILVNGIPIYTKADEVFRYYSDVRISHWAFAVFYGGDDTWAGGGGVIDIANLRVVKEL